MEGGAKKQAEGANRTPTLEPIFILLHGVPCVLWCREGKRRFHHLMTIADVRSSSSCVKKEGKDVLIILIDDAEREKERASGSSVEINSLSYLVIGVNNNNKY